MRPAYYQELWEAIQSSADPQPAQIDALARKVASTFIDRYFYSNEYNRNYIQLLCEMATRCNDAGLNQIAARALFGIVIERLCDDFEDLQTETYNRLICQVTDYLRRLPEGAELNQELLNFNLMTEEDLMQRVEVMRLGRDVSIPSEMKLRKVLVLSRVTIGADVAITSIICQRVLDSYPDAEIIVIGNDKLQQIFASHPQISVRELGYTRRGGLLERFGVWLELLKAVRNETADCDPQSFLVLDPDSRLTQLGVLPLVADRNYRFFNSRGKPEYPATASISSLTNLWLDWLFGRQEFRFPAIWLEPQALSTAEKLIAVIQKKDSVNVITLNFGVGGNSRKRIPDAFEVELVLSLLRCSENFVMLDLGFGDEERERSEFIIQQAQAAGFATQTASFAHSPAIEPGTRLLGMECNVGEIAALIADSHEFIGYDSACQHIAAAVGVKTYTIFAGTNNARFIRRWHASGPNLSEILYVDTISREHMIDPMELIDRLHDLRLN